MIFGPDYMLVVVAIILLLASPFVVLIALIALVKLLRGDR